MKNKELLDLYTDYLICSMGLATATGLSEALDHNVSHDKVSRFLLNYDGSSKQLWLKVKPYIRKIENTGPGCLIIDDTIEEKPYTDESELVTWHYSHSKHQQVKGINILSALIRYGDVALPIDYHLVTKSESYVDKNGQTKHRSATSKNEEARNFIATAKCNKIKFEYVLADIWFSSSENMKYVHNGNKKFIFGCKTNRLVRFNEIWHRLSDLPLSDEQVIHCHIKDVSFPVAITKKVFIHEDLSVGELYLISNDLGLSGTELYEIYQKRWIIEEYHKSIKQNASLARSPTKVIKTQSNHIFCSIFAFIKLEVLKLKTKINHFALKNKLFINATKAALEQLQKFRLMPNSCNIQPC
jgi:hypothetical protein